MRAAFKVYFASLADTWFNVTGYVECNVAAVLAALIVPAVVSSLLVSAGAPGALAVAAFLILLWAAGTPVFLGLQRVAIDVEPFNERPTIGMVASRARELVRPGLRLGAVQVAGTLLIWAGLYFYSSMSAAWAVAPLIVTVAAAWFAAGVLVFSGPMLLRSEGGVRQSLRNSMIAVLRYPGFTSTILILTALSLALSVLVAPLLLLFTASFVAVLTSRAVDRVLQMEGLISPTRVPEE